MGEDCCVFNQRTVWTLKVVTHEVASMVIKVLSAPSSKSEMSSEMQFRSRQGYRATVSVTSVIRRTEVN